MASAALDFELVVRHLLLCKRQLQLHERAAKFFRLRGAEPRTRKVGGRFFCRRSAGALLCLLLPAQQGLFGRLLALVPLHHGCIGQTFGNLCHGKPPYAAAAA